MKSPPSYEHFLITKIFVAAQCVRTAGWPWLYGAITAQKNATPFAAAARWTSCTLRGVASEIVWLHIHRDIYSIVTETALCVLRFQTCSRHVSLYDKGKSNLLRWYINILQKVLEVTSVGCIAFSIAVWVRQLFDLVPIIWYSDHLTCLLKIVKSYY